MCCHIPLADYYMSSNCSFAPTGPISESRYTVRVSKGMSMNEFRELAAKIDLQMQQLSVEGVSETHAIINRMMGHGSRPASNLDKHIRPAAYNAIPRIPWVLSLRFYHGRGVRSRT